MPEVRSRGGSSSFEGCGQVTFSHVSRTTSAISGGKELQAEDSSGHERSGLPPPMCKFVS